MEAFESFDSTIHGTSSVIQKKLKALESSQKHLNVIHAKENANSKISCKWMIHDLSNERFLLPTMLSQTQCVVFVLWRTCDSSELVLYSTAEQRHFSNGIQRIPTVFWLNTAEQLKSVSEMNIESIELNGQHILSYIFNSNCVYCWEIKEKTFFLFHDIPKESVRKNITYQLP